MAKAPRSRQAGVDGRVERGHRTRRAIIEAHADLLREGDLRPTAARIAQRAGVSVRTLWLGFGDMDGLYVATAEYWLARDEALCTRIDPQLDLGDRIERYCLERARRLEAIAPAARATVLHAWTSAALRQNRRRYERRLRAEIEVLFAAELASAGDRDGLLDALVVAAGWPTWSYLRDDMGRSVAEATARLSRMLSALLGLPLR